ncbi:Class E vacuolar protein-sorting machinery protein HSE1 [Termitomyces sp. J132]|nr:Class E vacuolar protein-sorting machinery protein HSE1 [Termitomyces sp. J132]
MSLFGGGAPNPYDDIVAKTTDENLTTENWELILNLCDKVLEEGQDGAHNVIASILKRLAHRNPNVQLYALSLTESLSKNCDIQLHREIASKAFTQALEKLVTDRTTHEKVRKRALSLVWTWTAEFEKDPTLGVMEDCYNTLKAKNYKFELPEETAPPAVDDEIRRKEEEELQRVLEMSIQDKGGRSQWSTYTSTSASSSAVGGSGSGSGPGYVPARTPSPQPISPSARQQTFYQPQQQPQSEILTHPRTQTPSQLNSRSSYQSEPQTPATTVASTSAAPASTSAIVTRVKALHTFEPTEPGELGFEKGDVIKVVDRGYKDWWRGQLKGRTGIFPVNYVEPLPEPTSAELAKEAEQEAAVFAQAVNVEKLLNLLRALDPAKDNLADNEEIQELYRSSMALRPKIVKLIDKYSQKRADLVSMNETFVRARTIFDRMMEESLARHTGVYDQPYRGPSYQSNTNAGRGYGWSGPQQAGYASFPTPAPAPPAQQPGYDATQSTNPQPATNYVPQGGYAGQQPNIAYGLQGPTPYPAQTQPQTQSQPQQQSPQLQSQVPSQPQSQAQSQPQLQPQQGGRDPAGAVYFISVPGVTSTAPLTVGKHQAHGQAQQQQSQVQQQEVQAQQQSTQQQQSVLPLQTQPPVHEDQPQQGVQPIQQQPQTSLGGPTLRSSIDTLPYPGENVPPTLATTLSSSNSSDLSYVNSPVQSGQTFSYSSDIPQQKQPQQLLHQELQPQTQLMGQEPAVNAVTVARAASTGSTFTSTTTPTWLLPKKSTPPPRLGHGSAHDHGNLGSEGHWA